MQITMASLGRDGLSLRVLSYPLPAATALDRATSLTPAERAIAEGLLAGLSVDELAGARGVSRRTVANQLAQLYRKLRVSSRFELLALATRHQWTARPETDGALR